MTNKNNFLKKSWRIWLINKLLSSKSNIDEVFALLSEKSEMISEKKLEEIDDNNENSLIRNIINLNEKSVEDIMVPRAEIISIEKNQNIKNILAIIKTEAHSRMPVYDQNLDNTLGFVHVKDVIKNLNIDEFEISKILRNVLYVAPKSPILDLLKRMRASRIHIGLVVDEFGGVDGLVTIEDLVEEIIGEIEDEHDADDDIKFHKIDKSRAVVDASYKLSELSKIYNIEIKEMKDDEIDTVGGLVFFLSGKVPKTGEIFKYNNSLNFKILSASNRRINTIEINKEK
ncbi:MAG: Hemolysin C [Alphaproteobacteria bacterium MarineAlpha5_Bin9]|nr:MAG: Hemolysin C [Alphaproteobacteria bacterium MarineAlpha5_Bin9]|tara:strand:+ start:5015 stop:5872 length:858 start_codon:yes stop_codon:yes gene_type:complete